MAESNINIMADENEDQEESERFSGVCVVL